MAVDPTVLRDNRFGREPDWGGDDPAPIPAVMQGLPVTLTDGMIPLDRDGLYVPNHLDAGGTVHFFATVDVSYQEDLSDLSQELRYYRAARADDGRLVNDAHPVMPLDGTSQPFPLPQLEMMLEDGDLENAQELAYHTARSHGFDFPEPEHLTPLNIGVMYAFELGVGDDGDPTVDAVKRWRDGGQDREVRQPIVHYGMSEEAARDQAELDDVREARGLEAAMNLAESMAVSSGALHEGRDDPRLFTDGPPDPFTTNAERDRALDENTRRLEPVEPETAVATFEAQFETSAYRLLQPVDPTVNYSFEVMPVDPWTLELTADKWWLEANGRVGHEGQALKTYSLESFEWERETERELAAMDCESLHRAYQSEGLEAAMRRAEGIAVANDELNPNRKDGRLFTEGPVDQFTTLRQAELAGLDARPLVDAIQDISNDDTQPLLPIAPEPGSWEELLARPTDSEPEPERHYWQMHYRSVETPEGEPMGTALFVTEFPQLPPDFDDYVEEYGVDDSIYPTEARTLEMAHFASEDAARKFATEFHSYLVPGLLNGPELAPEVAKLEGLSGEWEEMDYRGIVSYMSGNRTIVREADDWHLHNLNAEREAQEQLENPQTDIEL